jgi:TPR repeat protein
MSISVRALVLCAVAGAGVPFGVLVATVETPATQSSAPARSEGEDLYRRGLYPEAIEWWTQHAEKGDARAARSLGVEYMDGKGNVVQRDYEKARKYHTQAARAGDARSMMDLGTIYEHGLGVTSDLIEGARWYEWSAKYGHGPAQYNIATMLETGEAGRQDEIEAYKYYLLATAQGMSGLPYDTRSKRFAADGPTPLQALERRLAPSQRAEGKSRAKVFKAMNGPMPI